MQKSKITMKTFVVFIITLVILSSIPLASGFEIADNIYTEGWEEYESINDIESDYTISNTDPNEIDIVLTPDSSEGSTALEIDMNTGTFPKSGYVTLDPPNRISTDHSQNTTLRFDAKVQTNNFNEDADVRIRDGGGDPITITFRSGGAFYLDSTETFGGQQVGTYTQGVYHSWRIVIDYNAGSQGKVYAYRDGELLGSIDFNSGGEWTQPDNLYMQYGVNTGSGDGGINLRIDNIELQTTNIDSESISVDTNQYMKGGATQDYTVSLNRTYTNGTIESGDITNDTNVTSQNTSLITVNEVDHTLSSDSTNTGLTNVTFEYQGIQKNVTIFVGPRTIGNIADLPSSQWFAAAMGFDEEGTWYVMGSEIQMVLLAVFIGAATAWKARNEYLGIGVIILAIVLFWTADHVSIGIVMVSVFYGLFAAYQQRETPGRSDTNVNPNGGIDPERFRR